ncbi:MAG TPA: hypothetical protein ENI32_02425 [Candidatus Syntrophoarchaeum butanivorans]|uniref:Uncharacterized protein n=1 Tax=Candidatus Syntropharchaeum butanivorans TaxID=1839936 RepID=A0A1F2P4C9_9EURY|nr:MAG: hypothetical protein SBU_001576 [Candidatus Syntrophoarchaeum butanivorans]HEC56729.1 hypothetical protein [Candidatus Syntrophoarchaeum butanivorans]
MMLQDQDFRKEGINYVVPLRKNSKLMDTRWLRWRKPFIYRQRTIKWSRKKSESDEAVRGYFFVTLLALRIYFGVLRRLRERELTNRISVEEVFFELSKVQKIVEPSREYFARIPRRARRIMELFPELPMG